MGIVCFTVKVPNKLYIFLFQNNINNKHAKIQHNLKQPKLTRHNLKTIQLNTHLRLPTTYLRYFFTQTSKKHTRTHTQIKSRVSRLGFATDADLRRPAIGTMAAMAAVGFCRRDCTSRQIK